MNFLFQSKASQPPPAAESPPMHASEGSKEGTDSVDEEIDGILIVSGEKPLYDDATPGLVITKEEGLVTSDTKVEDSFTNKLATEVKTPEPNDNFVSAESVDADQFDDDPQLIVPSRSNSDLSVPSNVGISILHGLELSGEVDNESHNGEEILASVASEEEEAKTLPEDSALSKLTSSYGAHDAEAFMNVGNLLQDPPKETSKLIISDKSKAPSSAGDASDTALQGRMIGKMKQFAHVIRSYGKATSDKESVKEEESKPSNCARQEHASSATDKKADLISSSIVKSQTSKSSPPPLAAAPMKLRWVIMGIVFVTFAVKYRHTDPKVEVLVYPETEDVADPLIFETDTDPKVEVPVYPETEDVAGPLIFETDVANSSIVESVAASMENAVSPSPLSIETVPEPTFTYDGYDVAVEESTENSSEGRSSLLWRVVVLAMIGLCSIFPSRFNTVAEPPSKKKKMRGSYQKLPKDVDLTKYKELRVVDLKPLLKARQLKVSGDKASLVQRLVTDYEKELWGKTVVSLRASLKKKGLKQAGLKHELVTRLVEAGL